MRFTLKIDMDNDSFATNPVGELGECISKVAEKLFLSGNKPEPSAGDVKDSNGNTVGSWSII